MNAKGSANPYRNARDCLIACSAEWVNRVPRFRSRLRPDGNLETACIWEPGGSVVTVGFAQ